MRKNQEKSLDTLLKVINRALEKNYFPLVLKYLSLVAYVGLIIAGLSATSSDPVFLKELRNTNFGNPIVMLYWCVVCPVEIITSFPPKIGINHLDDGSGNLVEH
ncbi:MAG: hypothetical protein WD577_11740 [Bacteroidales bacterium]